MGSIIHVDNSRFFRKQMKAFLNDIGFESEGFDRCNDALNAIGVGGVSYVITGLELADMSGEEFIEKIIAIANHIPVIVVSSTEKKERADRLKTMGVEAVIGKSGNWKGELNQLLA
ncbi:MAG: response regulator [Treponema sp.]|jgi:DNA-binding NtrC family response regulator|nr:response regulator [Treponema sp.]